MLAVQNNNKLIANPSVVLREEFDDWAVLYNPDALLGFAGFGLNPTGVYVWKLINGERTMDEVADEMRHYPEGVPEEVREHISTFVEALIAEGLAAYSATESYPEKHSYPPFAVPSQENSCTYEPPRLISLSSGLVAQGACGSHGSQTSVSCGYGSAAAACCNSGSCGTPNSNPCCSGTCGGATCASGTGACDSYCTNGGGNTTNCGYGSSPTYQCLNGSSASYGCRCGSGGSCNNGFTVC